MLVDKQQAIKAVSAAQVPRSSQHNTNSDRRARSCRKDTAALLGGFGR